MAPVPVPNSNILLFFLIIPWIAWTNISTSILGEKTLLLVSILNFSNSIILDFIIR